MFFLHVISGKTWISSMWTYTIYEYILLALDRRKALYIVYGHILYMNIFFLHLISEKPWISAIKCKKHTSIHLWIYPKSPRAQETDTGIREMIGPDCRNLHTNRHGCIYICIYAKLMGQAVGIYTQVDTYTCIYVFTYTYPYTYTCTIPTYTRTYTYTYTYTYTCICVHTHTHECYTWLWKLLF